MNYFETESFKHVFYVNAANYYVKSRSYSLYFICQTGIAYTVYSRSTDRSSIYKFYDKFAHLEKNIIEKILEKIVKDFFALNIYYQHI